MGGRLRGWRACAARISGMSSYPRCAVGECTARREFGEYCYRHRNPCFVRGCRDRADWKWRCVTHVDAYEERERALRPKPQYDSAEDQPVVDKFRIALDRIGEGIGAIRAAHQRHVKSGEGNGHSAWLAVGVEYWIEPIVCELLSLRDLMVEWEINESKTLWRDLDDLEKWGETLRGRSEKTLLALNQKMLQRIGEIHSRQRSRDELEEYRQELEAKKAAIKVEGEIRSMVNRIEERMLAVTSEG